MPHLALFLLGPPRIERDGKSVKLNRRKAFALLAYLAVTDESHTRDALATLCWPALDQSRARAALSRTLFALKKAVGGEWLEIEWESLKLKRGPGFWLDVDHFRARLAECRTHEHPADKVCPACLEPLTEAVTLYRDDFLVGFTLRDSPTFDNWQVFQSESLCRELDGALEKLVRLHSTQGEFEPAIAYAQRRLAFDPFHEPTHRLIMQLYAQAGQRAAALRQYAKCVQVLEQELGVSPQEETVRLYQAIRQHRGPQPLTPTPRPRSAYPHNLPLQPTPLVGRAEELAEIDRLLEAPTCRLLTIIGPGGIGKTRLALQVALRAAAGKVGAFSQGIYFVPLAPLSSADFLVPAIANALEFSFQGSKDPKVQLLNYLREKEMLLLLDNFEHLLDGTGLLVEILSSVPDVKLLVTSRERLNLRWEWPFEIQGLRFPQDDKATAVEDYSAVQLFLQSASQSHPRFSLLREEKPFVARICRSLQGVPLAIEMAATWVEAFSCREISQRIERNLSLLTTSLQDVPERHRSMRAAFDHSWDLISGEEKSVFKKLSVFRGGFQREAAERVVGASLSVLSALMHKSFLHRNPAGRYETLEVLRQYGAEKLCPQEREKTHDLHCEYYAEFLHQREERLGGEQQKQALEEIGEEIANIRVAWEWAVEHAKTREIDRALKSLGLFYELWSWFQEGAEIFGRAAGGLAGMTDAMATPDGEGVLTLGKILVRQGLFCQRLSRFEKARESLEASLDVFRRLGAQKEMASALIALGSVAWSLGEYAKAQRLYQECLAIHKKFGDHRGVAGLLVNLGNVAWRMGQYEEARQLYQQGLVLQKEIGDQRGISILLGNLGNVSEALGEYEEAKQLHQQSLKICQEMGDQFGIAIRFTNLGLVAEAQEEYDKAKQLHQKALEICREISNQWLMTRCLNNLGFALCALKEYQQAQKSFDKALEMAVAMQATPVALEALVGMATLLKKDQGEQALELVTYVLHHPAAYAEIKSRAEKLSLKLTTQLSPQEFAMAQKRGKTNTLDYFVDIYGGNKDQ